MSILCARQNAEVQDYPLVQYRALEKWHVNHAARAGTGLFLLRVPKFAPKVQARHPARAAGHLNTYKTSAYSRCHVPEYLQTHWLSLRICVECSCTQ